MKNSGGYDNFSYNSSNSFPIIFMKQYLDLLEHVMDNGVDRDDRTGTGTRSVFGYQLRCDLSE